MRATWIFALAFAFGVAGIFAGHALRDSTQSAKGSPGQAQLPVPKTALQAGTPFPAVDLIDEGGQRRLSSELFASEGGVVLFLELECPPCVESAQRWQRLVTEGRVPASQVCGITMQSPAQIAAFRSELGLDFEILQDDGRRFFDEYRVTHFPMEVVVDGGGIIRDIGRDFSARAVP